MKHLFILFIALATCYSCTKQKSNLEIANDFYAASNAHNYKALSAITCDTVTIIDGDFSMDYGKDAYKTVFQWDSTFMPHYKVDYIEQSNADVFVKLSTKSKRFEYLGNNPLVTTHKISFTGNKIRTIELTEYVEADFETWVAKKDTLVNWIKVNHPELDGFIYDMTKQGAENYLKAIELFEATNE